MYTYFILLYLQINCERFLGKLTFFFEESVYEAGNGFAEPGSASCPGEDESRSG